MEESSSEDLFERFRRTGDPDALAAVFDQTAPKILRVALHVTGNPVEAEDLLQTTFLEAIECADSYDATRKVEPWLLGILTNQARLARRREARAVDEQRLPRRSSEDPMASAQATELTGALEEAIASLPAPYQPVLFLALRNGVSPGDIALALQRPNGTVRSQLTRGMELLRKALPNGFAVSALALALPVRGLAAIREIVLEKAATRVGSVVAAAPVTAWFAGGILVKKTLLAFSVSAAVVAVLGWVAFRWEGQPAALPQPEEVAAASPASRPRTDDAVPSLARSEDVATTRRVVPASDSGRLGSLLVRVRWEEDGKPAAGVSLEWLPSDVPDWSLHAREVQTSTDGTALLEGLASGRSYIGMDRGPEAEATIKAGERKEVDLEVPRGVLVEGTVAEAAGRGIGGAELLLSNESYQTDGKVVGKTEADGTFRLRSIPSRLCIGARAPGFLPCNVQQVLADPGKTVTLHFTLAGPAALLPGLVVDPDGRPVPGASVLVGCARSGGMYVDGKLVTFSPSHWLRTDAEGRFRADGVAQKGYPIWVRAPGFALWKTTVDGPIDPGQPLLVQLSRGATVEGRVTDEAGAPRAHVFFHAGKSWDQGPWWAQPTSVSADDGSFRIEGVPPGSVPVDAGGGEGGHVQKTLEVREGETVRWDFVLARGLSIRGSVVDEDGKPIAKLDVQATAPPGAPDFFRQAQTDRDGRFLIEGCAAGPHKLTIYDAKFAALVMDGVEPGEKEHRIVMPGAKRATASITGVILDPDGKPVKKSKIWILKEPFNGGPFAFTNGDTGRFEAAPLPPARYQLQAWVDGHPAVKLGEHAVAAGQHLDLGTIRLVKPGFITVEAQRADHQPVKECWGSVVDETGKLIQGAPVTTEGKRSPPMSPGSYVLKVWGKEVPLVERAFQLLPGADERIILELPPCVRRTIRFVKPTKELDLDLDVVWFDAAGKQLWKDDGGRWPGAMTADYPRCFTAGSWKVEAVSRKGLRGAATITVSDLSVPEETIEVPLR